MPTTNSWNSNIPVEISKGGSNATSMANTYGVNYYDGTRIVTSAVGTATHVLTSNGAGVAPTFQAVAAGGDVTAAANLTDDFVVTGDGGAKGVQTSTLKVSAAGEMTNASQPAFLAGGAGANNVTGDGTSFNIVFSTEIFDQGGDFDGTSTFTAPITGRYFLSTKVNSVSYTSSHTVSDFYIDTSNATYIEKTCPAKIYDNNTYVTNRISILADMDAADTAKVRIQTSNGTKVVDIINIVGATFFSGNLVC